MMLVAHDKNRTRRMADDLFRNTANEKPVHPGSAFAAHYDQIGFAFRCGLNDYRMGHTPEHLPVYENMRSDVLVGQQS